MKREVMKFLKELIIIGIAVSLVFISTGLLSPPSRWGVTPKPYEYAYASVLHSGPYRVIVQMNGNWSLRIWFSGHIDGNYISLWNGSGNYPTVIHIFVPSRGYLRIWTNNSGLIYFQRVRPSFQYDYLYQGLYLFIVFFGAYVAISIYERRKWRWKDGGRNDKTSYR